MLQKITRQIFGNTAAKPQKKSLQNGWEDVGRSFGRPVRYGINQFVQGDGMIGVEGSTRMDKHGHVSIQGRALGGFRVQIKI